MKDPQPLFLCLLVAACLAGAISGCNFQSDELEKQNAELQKKTDELSREMASRDEYIESVTTAINDVYSTIEGVRSREKQILRESAGAEGAAQATRTQVRQRLLGEIALIDSTLKGNQDRIAALEKKVSAVQTRFRGLERIIANLKRTLAEREAAIAQLESNVRGLQTQLSEKTRLVAQKDSVIESQNGLIDNQHRRLTTGYYIVGKRDDLEHKGIIAREGGFLWGLVGATTVLSNGFDASYFKPINKTESTTIEVDAPISEIIPKRNERFYNATRFNGSQSLLRILEPTGFWQDEYLVIVTD